MTSLACCAQDLGLRVTGSDVADVFVTDAVLRRRKISWRTGFDPRHIGQPDLLVTTGAHGGFENPEVVTARARGIQCVSQAEALGMFAAEKITLSVCGVGGKSTTSAMLATCLEAAGAKPSYSIGVGQLYPLGDPGRMSSGRYFVAEADEYAVSPGIDQRPRFQFQHPKVAVLTNLEHDHPDVYPQLSATKKVFHAFLSSVGPDGVAVICRDNLHARQLAGKLTVPVETYGLEPPVDWLIRDFTSSPGKTSWVVDHHGVQMELILSVPGQYNALNATAALVVGAHLGFPVQKLIQGLKRFGGTQRRFQKIGLYARHWLYDDYAHHPSEIRATLRAAKQWFPDRQLIVIFQPHTYSRTKVLLDSFAAAFHEADQVLITEIYASAREGKSEQFSAWELVERAKEFQPHVVFTPGLENVLEALDQRLDEPSVVMTIGAGDIFRWHAGIRTVLKKH